MCLLSVALSVSADAKEEAERTMGWGSVAVWAIMALLFSFCVVAVVLPLLDGTSSKENVLATPSRNDEACCRRTRVRNICLGNTNHSYFILPSHKSISPIAITRDKSRLMIILLHRLWGRKVLASSGSPLWKKSLKSFSKTAPPRPHRHR